MVWVRNCSREGSNNVDKHVFAGEFNSVAAIDPDASETRNVRLQLGAIVACNIQRGL